VENEDLRRLLNDVQSGNLDVATALTQLETSANAEPAIAVVDLDRLRRTGHPEVVFGEGKEAADIVTILQRIALAKQPGLVTRLTDAKAEDILREIPGAVWHRRARVLHNPCPGHEPTPDTRGRIAIVSAGTSDIPVAEEAAVIAETLGHDVDRIWDVGVAGLHRILKHQSALQSASVVIVVAGMEGALASVVAGLVPCPVVAVPTSVGYGASFHGLAALLGMLNACATGVSVVNIDNGFGAAMMAVRINESRP
jgi:NCAIR mutase (PurE)-related protein